MNDIINMCEITCLVSVTVDFRRPAVHNVICELRDDICIFTFVFFSASIALIDREEMHSRH